MTISSESQCKSKLFGIVTLAAIIGALAGLLSGIVIGQSGKQELIRTLDAPSDIAENISGDEMRFCLEELNLPQQQVEEYMAAGGLYNERTTKCLVGLAYKTAVDSRHNTGQSSNSTEVAAANDAYDIWSLQHRKNALQLQLLKDNMLFGIVLLVVLFGVYLSYVQFTKGAQTEGTVKLGPAGFEVTSSVLGVIILTFSLAFFYLYLVHIFPITELEMKVLQFQLGSEEASLSDE